MIRTGDAESNADEPGSPFDLLCPELIDCIVKKAIEHEGTSLRPLACVSTSFLMAAERCSTTLVIVERVSKLAGPSRTFSAGQLLKEKAQRPNVVRLRVEGGVLMGLWSVVSFMEWESVRFRKCGLDKPAHTLFSSLKVTKSLEFEGDCIELVEDFHNVMSCFPKLDNLVFDGCFHVADTPDGRVDPLHWVRDWREHYLRERKESSNSPIRLDISRLTWDPSAYWFRKREPIGILHFLGPCLSKLRSLKLRCQTSLWGLKENELLSLETLEWQVDCYSPQSMQKAVGAIAKACPSLKSLKLVSWRPLWPSNEPQEPIDIFGPLTRCQQLERILVSYAVGRQPEEFLQVVRRQYRDKRELDVTEVSSKMLILTGQQLVGLLDDFASCCHLFPGKEFAVYAAVMSQNVPAVCNGVPGLIRKQAIGDNVTVSKWIKSFCSG